MTAAQVEIASQVARFDGVEGLDYDTRRKLDMLRSGIVVPAPQDAGKTAEQAGIGARLSSMYGKGRYCREDGSCLALGELENIMARSRDPGVRMPSRSAAQIIAAPMRHLTEYAGLRPSIFA